MNSHQESERIYLGILAIVLFLASFIITSIYLPNNTHSQTNNNTNINTTNQIPSNPTKNTSVTNTKQQVAEHIQQISNSSINGEAHTPPTQTKPIKTPADYCNMINDTNIRTDCLKNING